MDQNKIGKFIARLRKDKKMTQEELAEKLSVSNKSISRWENGKCMPDISLLIPLSKNLEVSVNDLLSGKKVDEKDYQESFEENILNVMTTIDRTNKMYKKFLKVLLIIVIIFLLLCTLFGIIDYFRAVNGKRPIFIYHTANVFNYDIQMAGFEDSTFYSPEGLYYYGIGYMISTCDIESENYTFQLGHKQKKYCQTSLSCTKTFTENNIHFFDYDFFEDKLIRITTSLTIPALEIANVETYKKEFMKINNISGCNGYFGKENETTYTTTQVCDLSRMSNIDVQSVYGSSKSSLIQTRDGIIDSYSHDKDMKCQ